MSESHLKSGCLTYFLWCSPTVIVPIILLMMADAWPIGAVINLAILAWFGIGLYAKPEGVTRSENLPFFHRTAVKTTLFVLAQIVIIPLVWVTVIYGACLIAGGPPKI